MNGRTGGTRMSIDRVIKKTLRLSLSLGAVVAQRAPSTRCHELPLGSASEYCDRGVQATGCLGLGRVASGWMARSVHLGCYIAQSHRREKGGINPFLGGSFGACCSLSFLQSVHSPYQPSAISLSRQLPMIPLYCLR